MSDQNNLPSYLPDATKATAQKIWETLNPADRQTLQELLDAFPSQTNLAQLLFKLANNQFKMAFGNKRKVAIVGPTNVGKSTLFNQLVQHKEDRAAVSLLPGTTRQNQQADAGVFAIVDTPGADSAGKYGLAEQEMALNAAADSDFLLIMFDAIQGIKQAEKDLFNQLSRLGKPYIVLINKIDLVRREKKLVIENAAEILNLTTDQIIPIVARTGENLDDILISIAVMEPAMVAALGRALPQYRWQLAWRSIISAASASAVIALTPLPVIDFIPLVALQSVMVLSIARVYSYDITLERARELVVTFGLGFLGRILFQELSKLGGLPGWVLSAAVAASTTAVMGYAASVWFETGEQVSKETLKKITMQLTNTLLERLRKFGKRKPGKQSLQDSIRETLESIPVNEDRANIAKID